MSVPCDFIKTAWIFFKECSKLFQDLYLFREPINYCFDRARATLEV